MEPNQPGEPAVPRSSKTLAGVLIGVVVAALVSGGGVYAYQKSQNEAAHASLQSQIDSLKMQVASKPLVTPTSAPTNSPITTSAPLTTSSPVLTSTPSTIENWKQFTSDSGWSIQYPSNYTLSSCHACSNLTQKEIGIDFNPPAGMTSSVAVLTIDPSSHSANESLQDQLNRLVNDSKDFQVLDHQNTQVSGFPSLTVTFIDKANKPTFGSNPDQIRWIFVKTSQHLYFIQLINTAKNQTSGLAPEKFSNYQTLQKMLSSLTITQ